MVAGNVAQFIAEYTSCFAIPATVRINQHHAISLFGGGQRLQVRTHVRAGSVRNQSDLNVVGHCLEAPIASR